MLSEGHVLNGTYKIVRLIGEGGMGFVYEATHARLAGRYAVKVLLQSLSENPEALRHFDREAKITSSLQHPNIVQVVDFDRTPEGVDYLVMEYLQGETLTNRLLRLGPLSPSAASEVVSQLAAALAAAHGHNIVHRDLKPDNVFLVSVEGLRGELVKVLDFGISKMRDAARRPDGPVSALMGTPQYMSPEQCQGKMLEVDGASDQFALAAITYEMLTGHPPFPGNTVGDVLARVLYHDPPPMIGIAAPLEAVVRRGLAKAKQDRFPSVTSFAEAFAAAVAACADTVNVAQSGGAWRASGVSDAGRLDHGAADARSSAGVVGGARHPEGTARSALVTPTALEGALRVPRRKVQWREWGAVMMGVAAAAGVMAFFTFKGRQSAWRVEYNSVEARPPEGMGAGVREGVRTTAEAAAQEAVGERTTPSPRVEKGVSTVGTRAAVPVARQIRASQPVESVPKGVGGVAMEQLPTREAGSSDSTSPLTTPPPIADGAILEPTDPTDRTTEADPPLIRARVSSTFSRATQPVRRSTAPAATAKPTRARTLPPPPLDEDAPLPLDENFGEYPDR